ncbi:hypothetical protein HK103_000723 [Boothiomyces macroporosus]|uniref:L domain-like protein n=1 Tax=Boothiomyces macroporosus TaxID=261099 RepID=A0AAD5Y1B6_9FUNG|nr:hypothetical protein HK103_000723 [Boothiomyces macroporosus]
MTSDCSLFNQKIYPSLTGGNGTLNLCCTSSVVRCDNNKKITEINFLGIHLGGTIPNEIGQLSNLVKLDLGQSGLRSTIPPSISQLNQLTYLGLGYNHFATGPLPDLSKTTKLQILTLQAINVADPSPGAIFNLSNLQILDLSDNNLNWNLDTVLKGSRSLANTTLSGTTNYLTMLPKIQTLYLGNNSLTGLINPNISTLQNLRVLFLNDNLLTGSIPPQLSNLLNLQQLFGDQKAINPPSSSPSPSSSPQESNSSSPPLLGLYIALPKKEKSNLEGGKRDTVRFSIDDPTDITETFDETARLTVVKQNEISPPMFQKEDINDSDSDASTESSEEDNAQLGQIYKINRKAIDKSSTLGTNETVADTSNVTHSNPATEGVPASSEVQKSQTEVVEFTLSAPILNSSNANETIPPNVDSEHDQPFDSAFDSNDFNLLNRVKITDEAKSIETSIADNSEGRSLPRDVTIIPKAKETQEEKFQIPELLLNVINFDKEHHIGGDIDEDQKLKSMERKAEPSDGTPDIPNYYFDSFVSLADSDSPLPTTDE